MKINSIKK